MKKILLSLLIFANLAHAEWTTIAVNSKNDPIIAIDYDRSFNSNGIPTVWWKNYSYGELIIVKRPTNHPMSIFRSKIDCQTRMISHDYRQDVEVKHFYDLRPEIYEPSWNGPGSWYVPDMYSAEEFIVKKYCK